jgi:APA family basic amino acid/polyamine antiporter
MPSFKMPFYPVLPALGFLGALAVFWGLDIQAKTYALGWFVLGMVIYFAYGMNHSTATLDKQQEEQELEPKRGLIKDS